MTAEELAKLSAMVNKQRTLAQAADGHLDEMHNIKEGRPAPEIDGVDVEGKPLKLSDYRGKVVTLVFWGSWCGPCTRQVPHEHELAEKFRGGPFALLGVNWREIAEVARKTIEAERMNWPNWHDGDGDAGPIVEKFHVRGYPTLLLIDSRGMIRNKNAWGDSWDSEFEKMVKEAETPKP